MHRYTAYGLTIHSEILLPELPECVAVGARPDVTLRLGPVHTPALTPVGDGSAGYAVDGDRIFYAFDGVGSVCMEDGSQVTVSMVDDISPQRLRIFLLGPVLAAVLHERADAVFHASAVSGGEGAVAIGGDAGMGKSTLAAALYRRGFGVIADDLVVAALAAVDGEAVTIEPGFPRLKLWPEAGRLVGYSDGDLGPDAGQTGKQWLSVEDGFPDGQVTLGKFILLKAGAVTSVKAVRGHEALRLLMGQAYRAPWATRAQKVAHFGACAQIVHDVPVVELTVPSSLEGLVGEMDVLESHFREF